MTKKIKPPKKIYGYMTYKGCDCLVEIPPYGLTGGNKCPCGHRQTLKVIRSKKILKSVECYW